MYGNIPLVIRKSNFCADFATLADSLTRCAAKDYGKKGIRVNAIAPGYVDTPMTGKMAEMVGPIIKQMCEQMAALGRVAQPEEIATLIAFLLSDDASYVSSNQRTYGLSPDECLGHRCRVSDRWWDHWLSRRVKALR